MKSAYELAMERLQKQAPSIHLNAEQKAEIAELESQAKARIAEREIALKDAMGKAAAEGNAEEMANLEQRLANEKKKILDELEAKKEAVRGQ
jgi:hypothetical protein